MWPVFKEGLRNTASLQVILTFHPASYHHVAVMGDRFRRVRQLVLARTEHTDTFGDEEENTNSFGMLQFCILNNDLD